ncbi:MAG: RNA-binding domain-containing protein, partial [Desulfitobacterium sp.]
IIDGMQRLNALFGFIENQFPIIKENEEQYFSVKDYTFAQTIADRKIFNVVENKKLISQEEVSSLISYQFPVTIFESKNYEDINETFRRINANGKHLSPQEVRQAGNTTQLSSLVREIASEIRGDASKDILLLSEMPEISIDSKMTSFGYGVNAEDTFWCNQGVLRISELRDSEDEELIADILLSIILNQPFPASKTEFNNYYGSGETDKSKDLEIKINALGKDNIKKDAKIVFSEIFNFCGNQLKGIRLKYILNPKAGGNSVKEAFYTLFMAFYELIIKQQKSPFNYLEIENAIKNLHSKLSKTNNHISTSTRIKNINLTKGLIENYFKNDSSIFRSPTTYIVDFQTYLMKSKVESAVYDFKQGLLDLNPSNRKFNRATFENKIIKNIAALANLGKGKKGYLFIGVTDKEEDTLQVEKIDGLLDCPRYYNFGIVGLEREAKIAGVSLDEYISSITERISISDLPNDLKTRITKAITPITYNGMTVLMIEVECGDSPVYFKDIMYARDGARCVEVKGSQQADIFRLFK